MSEHQIIVGNVGTVLTTESEELAAKTFQEYVEISKSGRGRAGGEEVSWLTDGDLRQSYEPAKGTQTLDSEDGEEATTLPPHLLVDWPRPSMSH